MITDTAFPFFARRKRATAAAPRNLKQEAPRGRRGLHLWRRGEMTTFHKCLAVHMYFASPRRLQK